MVSGRVNIYLILYMYMSVSILSNDREQRNTRKRKGGGGREFCMVLHLPYLSVNIPDGKFAFQLVEPDQSAYTFIALSNSEKREWMSALTQLLTKSTFDRLLDAKLREEEKTIPILRPDSNKYMYVKYTTMSQMIISTAGFSPRSK